MLTTYINFGDSDEESDAEAEDKEESSSLLQDCKCVYTKMLCPDVYLKN